MDRASCAIVAGDLFADADGCCFDLQQQERTWQMEEEAVGKTDAGEKNKTASLTRPNRSWVEYSRRGWSIRRRKQRMDLVDQKAVNQLPEYQSGKLLREINMELTE